ncbi:MAG: amidohydrolase family protein [Chloroflexi bacterium]|nr:amidohydrolase family protein [Chloroflexota bacterium]
MAEKADLLFTNALVLAMDEAMNQFEVGALAIKGDTILAAGPEAELRKKFDAKEIVDCGGKVLMPGLVNAHTHVPMTLLRGLADDLRLDVWLMGYIMPVEREFVNPEFVRLGTSIGCAEFIRSGVTTFADMYYFESSVAEATAAAGLRAVCGQTIMRFPSPDAQSFEDSLAATRQFIEQWLNHPLIVPAVSPHAPYSCTEEILRASAALAAEFDVPLHTHIAETAFEVENARRDWGMPVVPYVKKQNLFDAKVLAAHCVHVDAGEINTLKHHGAGIAHNPSSNLKLASGAAPVAEMLNAGLNVGIGTDGPASNNDLDMFEEVRLAAFLSKFHTNDPTSLPAQTALLMATRLGAQALHIGQRTGSLEAGKRADLILVDINQVHNSPHFRRDPNSVYAQLVYATKATDVSDVMVNGKWVMRHHELLTLDESEMLAHAADLAKEIDSFLIARESSVLSKLIAIGGTTQEESFEIQVKVKVEDPKPILGALTKPGIKIIYNRHYREYDAYFKFKPQQGILRYREDEFLNERGEVDHVRYRLTLVGDPHEREFPSDVMLSRSRFLAPANQSLRFYREYFQPSEEIHIVKDRRRWLVRFKDTEFYVNLDRMDEPALGFFLELKTRTWSRRDAEHKSTLVLELAKFLGVSTQETEAREYVRIVEENK